MGLLNAEAELPAEVQPLTTSRIALGVFIGMWAFTVTAAVVYFIAEEIIKNM